MPIVRISLAEGRSSEQKAMLAKRVTEAVSEALGAPSESVRVLLTELPPEHWYVGGMPLHQRC